MLTNKTPYVCSSILFQHTERILFKKPYNPLARSYSRSTSYSVLCLCIYPKPMPRWSWNITKNAIFFGSVVVVITAETYRLRNAGFLPSRYGNHLWIIIRILLYLRGFSSRIVIASIKADTVKTSEKLSPCWINYHVLITASNLSHSLPIGAFPWWRKMKVFFSLWAFVTVLLLWLLDGPESVLSAWLSFQIDGHIDCIPAECWAGFGCTLAIADECDLVLPVPPKCLKTSKK